MKIIDFRSDTITRPTEEMRAAMSAAEVGDDVYGEDPTVNKLEELAAETIGKEAALFVPSGTMGNLIALLAHTRHGQQVVLDDLAHIIQYEAGGLSAIAGLVPRIISTGGVYTAETIESAIVSDSDVHHAQTGLICLENTHNIAGGIVTPPAEMKKIHEMANKYSLPVHTDGARIFNAATYLGCAPSDLASHTDSVMFCLSKGLASPAGSILAGTKEFVVSARKIRKRLGGGMRQIGILAAAGIISIRKMSKRLDEDHLHARLLGEALANMKGFSVDLGRLQTNILMVDLTETGASAPAVVEDLAKIGILASDINEKRIRFVTHYQVSRTDIQDTIDRLSLL